MKEQILVRRIKKKKDAQAFDEVYEMYANGVNRHVLLRIPSKEEAEDIKQEVFLKLWDYLISSERSVKNLKALIYKITQNLIAAYYVNQGLNKTHKDKDKIDLEEVAWKVEDKRVNMEKELEVRTKIEIISKKISEVDNVEYEQVIRLKLFDELSHREIANILKKPEGHVRVILHRGLKKLRKIIEESNEI